MLRLGSLVLDFPVIQAALSGYSNWPMRTIAKRHGAPYTIHEVMLDRFVQEVKVTHKTRHHFQLSDRDRPTGAQLMGSDPKRFGSVALKLVEAGFDVIDLNFGCPVKSARTGCRGGYLLSQPKIAVEIIRRVRDAVPESIPVTVKMRRGLDDSESSREQFFQIFDGAFSAGVAAITVHGRTVEQKYRGPSDWSFLREVKHHAGQRTVLGSGDLFSAQDCRRMMKETGVDGVTVARGAIGNPWIFQQCRCLFAGEPVPDPPDVHEQAAVIREHFSLAEQVYGERCLGIMRKMAIKYARVHPHYEQVRNAFAQVRTRTDWESVFVKHYRDNLPGRYPFADEINDRDASASVQGVPEESAERCGHQGPCVS